MTIKILKAVRGHIEKLGGQRKLRTAGSSTRAERCRDERMMTVLRPVSPGHRGHKEMPKFAEIARDKLSYKPPIMTLVGPSHTQLIGAQPVEETPQVYTM